jgi:ComF family protein
MVFAKFNPLPGLISLLYPPACAICSADVEPDKYLCEQCQAKLVRIKSPFCSRCSEPFQGQITNDFECANCAHRRLYFETAVSAFRSRGIVRQVILDFKYRGQFHLRHLVATWILAALEDDRLRTRQFDLMVPVPLHPARKRQRGFNQAAVLAELLSRRISVPCRGLLERVRYTTTQTAFDRTERMENLRGAFRLGRNPDVRQLRVLLIDDILTTGSTLSECARVLKSAGALSVHAATAARG